MEKLKNCPFCGRKAYYYKDTKGISVENMTVNPNVVHFVLCIGCSAVISGRSEEEVVEGWNRRDGNGRI